MINRGYYMRKIIKPVIFIFLLLCAFFFPYKDDFRNVNAVNGFIDLTNYNFDKDGIVNLQGQWELYNNALLTPDELKNKRSDRYLVIPCELKTQLNGQTTGYMTLRLRIHASENVVYGLRTQGLLSASKIWVNGVLQGQVGIVGKSYEEERSIYLPTYSYFTAKDGIIDIVIQTSNYRDLFPVIHAMQFSTKDRIMNEFLLDAGVDLIIIGALFVLELLNLSLYIRLKNNKSSLYFSILCLFVQLRCLFLNERIVVRFFPNMPFELLSKTAALTYYLWLPVYVLFLKEIFKDLPGKLTALSWAFGISFGVICIITNNTFYDRLSYLGEGVLAVIVTSLFIFMVKKVIVKEKYSEISFVAFLFLVLTSINDILVNNGMVFSKYGFQIGMFIFAILETYILTIRHSDETINLEKLRIDNKIIYERSIRDSLTNLYNRDYIENILDNMMKDYIEYGNKFTVLMIDIDFFKAVNDNFGHPYGDKILIEISKVLQNTLRPTDYVGRYGGEEFIIILPNTTKEKAKELAENIRRNIRDIYLENGASVTISGGLYENDTFIKQECIKNADNLLYSAKKDGRDRIAV